MVDGIGRLAQQRLLRPAVKRDWGVDVRYHSWNTGEVYPTEGGTIRATLDDSGADAETEGGIQFTEQFKDFKIDVPDLPVMPQDRDVIMVVTGLGVPNQFYQVLSPGGSRSVEPLNNFEDVWRIHTKNVPNPSDELVQVLYGNASGLAYGNADPEGTGYASSRR